MACSFFEQHPDATVESATQQLAGSFQAQRANQFYYVNLTLRNAFDHVHGGSSRSTHTGKGASAATTSMKAPEAPQQAASAADKPGASVSKEDVQCMPLGSQ